jgi:hypothetical protein
MAYSEAKFKSSVDKASPYFKPFLIRNISDKCVSTQTMINVSIEIFLLDLTVSWGYQTEGVSCK